MTQFQSLDEVVSTIEKICEENVENPLEHCFVRGETSLISGEELLEKRSEDIVETDLKDIISEAEELLRMHPELEDTDSDYYSFIRLARRTYWDVEKFIRNCEDETPGKGNVCATVLYYLSNNERDKIFKDSDIVNFYVGDISWEVVDEIKCNEENCVVRYNGLNADPYYAPCISLDYPYLYIIEGERLGENLYKDGDIIIPKRVIDVLKMEL